MWRYFFYCILLGLLVGCSGNVKLRGKVTYSDDGSPVTAGTVAFLSDGKMARGSIQKDGTYVVGFERMKDGLPPGEYEVFISNAFLFGEYNPVTETHDMVPLIDGKYAHHKTSGLTVSVNARTKAYHIEVDRYTPPSRPPPRGRR